MSRGGKYILTGATMVASAVFPGAQWILFFGLVSLKIGTKLYTAYRERKALIQ